MREILSMLFLILGILFITVGTYGLLKYQNFYSRILISSQIDTVGFLSIMISMIIKSGFTFYTAKILIICLLGLIISPLNTHSIVRSAYKSGYKLEKDNENAP